MPPKQSARVYTHHSSDAVDRYRSLHTAGGGACGIHAIIGESTAGGTIKASAPRRWVSELVQRCTDPASTVEYLTTQGGADRASRAVHDILLAVHCADLLREASGPNPTHEARCLEDCLVVEGQTDLLSINVEYLVA